MGSSVQCPVDSETISLVLDGEADAQQRQDYEEHLDQCPACRRQHEFYSQLRSTVRASCSAESCPDLVKARLMKALQAEVETNRPIPASIAASPAMTGGSRARWARGVAGLAAASAAAFSFYALRPSTAGTPPLALSLSEDHSRCCDQPAGNQPHSPAELALQTFGSSMPEMVELNHLQPYDVRVCNVSGGRVIHVLARDAQQRVVSMYTMPRAQYADWRGSEDKPELYETAQARVATWEHKGWVFSLVSRVPHEELATMASSCSYGCPDDYSSPLSPELIPRGMPVRAIPASHRP